MPSDLYRVMEWAKDNGEVKVVDRLRIKTLKYLVKEDVSLDKVGTDTVCSPEMLAALRSAAADVIGKPCPV